MSVLTAEGRKKARDVKLDGVYRTLRLDKTLSGLSRYQRGTLAELKLIGRDLYNDIKRRGVILPDGEVNSCSGGAPQKCPRAAVLAERVHGVESHAQLRAD